MIVSLLLFDSSIMLYANLVYNDCVIVFQMEVLLVIL